MSYFAEYVRHAMLNLGQAAQGARYIYSHPDMDLRHPRGSLRHFAGSVAMRSRLVVNDLVYAVLPPRWHHSTAQLQSMLPVPVSKWFNYGYCAWRFTGTADKPVNLATVDRRWDPRCKAARP